MFNQIADKVGVDHVVEIHRLDFCAKNDVLKMHFLTFRFNLKFNYLDRGKFLKLCFYRFGRF